MLCYFDTSALLKRYVEEKGSHLVQELFENKELIAVTSSITLVEGTHVICRKCTEEKISPKIRQKLLRDFLRDMNEIRVVIYSPDVIKKAQSIIKAHGTKTLDAIHIASALILKQPGGAQIHFASSDYQQNKVAKQAHLLIINPLD